MGAGPGRVLCGGATAPSLLVLRIFRVFSRAHSSRPTGGSFCQISKMKTTNTLIGLVLNLPINCRISDRFITQRHRTFNVVSTSHVCLTVSFFFFFWFSFY